MGRSSENAGPLQLPDSTPCSAVPYAVASAQDLVKDHPVSFLPSLEQPLQNLKYMERVDVELHPLQHAHAELKAEQSSLLLKNSELLSQTLMLKLENQRLRQQLELQLQEKKNKKMQTKISSSISSTSLNESSNDSDDEGEEVKSVLISSDDFYTSDDSC